jgi:Trp operon repressor
VVAKVKEKVIDEYKSFVKRLHKGYKDDYKHILDMICFIQIHEALDNKNFIYEKLINE